MNTVVHALSDRYGAVHLHACEGAWVTDRAMWSADRLHPGEPGHRRLAVRFHELLTSHGAATGPAPSPGSDSPAPARWASLRWPATAGTGWVARRCTDLLPQLLGGEDPDFAAYIRRIADEVMGASFDRNPGAGGTYDFTMRPNIANALWRHTIGWPPKGCAFSAWRCGRLRNCRTSSRWISGFTCRPSKRLSTS